MGRYIGDVLTLDWIQRCYQKECSRFQTAFSYADERKLTGDLKKYIPLKNDVYSMRAAKINAIINRATFEAVEMARTYAPPACPVQPEGISPDELNTIVFTHDGTWTFNDTFNTEEEVWFKLFVGQPLRDEVRSNEQQSLDAVDREARHLGADSAILAQLLSEGYQNEPSVTFSGTVIIGASLCNALLEGDFANAYISGNASGATFRSASLEGANISYLHVSHATFGPDVNLKGTVLAACLVNEGGESRYKSFWPVYKDEKPDFRRTDWRESATAQAGYSRCGTNDTKRYLEQTYGFANTTAR
jgi:uncharacterized protein YjbI with pentapeptide repeats